MHVLQLIPVCRQTGINGIELPNKAKNRNECGACARTSVMIWGSIICDIVTTKSTTPKPRIPERRHHGEGYEVGSRDSSFPHITIQQLQKYIIFNLLLFSVPRPLQQQALDSIMLFEDLLSMLLSLFRNSWVYIVMRVSYTYRQHLEWENILFKVAL